MAEMLFKKTGYTLQGLLPDIDMGRIGLPDIQRPFVWPKSKVRALLGDDQAGRARARAPMTKPAPEMTPCPAAGHAA